METIDIFGELRIKNVFQKIGINNPEQSYEMIKSHYLENHRAYHNLDHIVFGLDLLWELQAKLGLTEEEFNTLVVAWAFHDLIYEIGEKDNEKQSSNALWDWCIENNLSQEFAYEVCDLVEVTDHFNVSAGITKLQKIIRDLDLANFGASWEKYQKAEQDVKDEVYVGKTESEYRERRGKLVLPKFLKEEFETDVFKNKFGEQRKKNIQQKIKQLKKI